MSESRAVIEVVLTHKKDTKGTKVFESLEDEPAIPSLYIRKAFAPKSKKIRVVVFEVQDE